MSIWGALITLVGVLAASGAVTELVKRRDRRASILSDLAIWEKLPDGLAKDLLLKQLTVRIILMADEKPTYSWISFAFGLTWFAAYGVLFVFSNGLSLKRDDKTRVLYVVGDGLHLQFLYAVYIAVGLFVLNALWLLFITWVTRKFSDWLGSRKEPKTYPNASGNTPAAKAGDRDPA